MNNRYAQFDDFLAREVPLIESSPAFGKDGVIVVLYDEDQRMGGLAPKNGLASGGHTPCALISPLVQPGEYADPTYSYSALRTIQDGFGLGPYLGSAAQVRSPAVARTVLAPFSCGADRATAWASLPEPWRT